MRETQIWPGWDTVRSIGSGGYGKVYEIRKTDSTGSYGSALKVISIPRSADEYREYEDNGYDDKSITAIFKSQVDDIVSEFKMMSQFKGTSNIVSYEDHMIVPHEDGRGWDILIRMELLTPLPEYINQHGLTEGQAVQMGSDICQALERCAQKGIIHRDIKPQNIFVNEFGDFKLGDFGIARSMDHTTKATKTGTYSYMAPEVYCGKPYGASVDIYSLGLVLYWVLNERRLPFLPLPPTVPTAAQNSEAQMKRFGGTAIPEPKHGGGALKTAVLTACSFDSASRFDGPKAFRQALDACGCAQENVILPPQSQSWERKTTGPSKEAADYTAGEWSMKFTTPPKGGGQHQGEVTKGAWDDSSSVHWIPDGDSGHTSRQKSAERTETNRSDPFVDAFNDNMETAQVTKPWGVKRVLKIATIVIAVCVVASLISFGGSGQISFGRGVQRQIDYTVGTLDGTTYVNEWANLRFAIPEGWEIRDAPDDKSDTAEYGLCISEPSRLAGRLRSYQTCDVYFEMLEGDSLSQTEEEYLDFEVFAYTTFLGCQFDGQYEKVKLGNTFTAAHFDDYFPSLHGVLSIYVRKLENRMCVIEVCGKSREANNQLVSGFTKY